jgi:hypothetical protein
VAPAVGAGDRAATGLIALLPPERTVLTGEGYAIDDYSLFRADGRAIERDCRGGDSNPYALASTAPSKQRVYLFHHLGG